MILTLTRKRSFPDLYSQPTAHVFGENWDSIAVARIIRDKSEEGRSPAFLFLGRKETELLRAHLATAYGEEAVSTLHATYYMGLKVVTVDTEQYICTGGSKVTRSPKRPSFLRAS